ncbi:MAG: Gluconate dehydratase, partial [uncultured Acetobacteraceae bacterium]
EGHGRRLPRAAIEGGPALHLRARLALRDARLLRRRDHDGRGHHRLGRVLRPRRGEQGAHRDAVPPARGGAGPVRRRGGVGRPLQPHQGLRRDRLRRHRDLGHRHRAVGRHRPRRGQADPQADRRRPPHGGDGLRHRPLLHRHGSADRGGGRRSGGVRGPGLPGHQNEDRARRPEARPGPDQGGAGGDRAERPSGRGRQPLLHRAASDPPRPGDGAARHPLVRGADQPRGPRRLRGGHARARHGGRGRRERVHPLGLPRHGRAQGDGHRAARRLRRRRHQRDAQDRHPGQRLRGGMRPPCLGQRHRPRRHGAVPGRAAGSAAGLPPDPADAGVRADAEPAA